MADVVTTKFSDWKFYKYHIMENTKGGQYINAESTLVAAGPPQLSDSAGSGSAQADMILPVGLLETFGLQQSRQLQRIFEIGSSRSYFVPGRTIGSVSLGRTFYYGPSLLRVLYAYWHGSVLDDAMGAPNTLSTSDGSDPLLAFDINTRVLQRNPGYGHLLIDLASDLFALPTGMAVYFKDAFSDTYGGFYLEYCYVQGHQMTISSGSVLIMEGVSIQYDLLVPIDIGPRKSAPKT